ENESNAGEHNEEGIVVLERSKGRAVVGYVHQREKIWDDPPRLIVRMDVTDHDPLGELIQEIERQREEQDVFHRFATTDSHRSHKSGCAALFPTLGLWRQQRAHF